MSAFVVNNSHIDVLVQFATMSIRRGSNYYYFNGESKRLDDANTIGRILLAENQRSVNYRYDDSEETPEYRYMSPSRQYTPVEIIKACDCLNYQSCETPDWEETEAFKILETIKYNAIHALPGYESADWEITDERRYPRPEYTIMTHPSANGFIVQRGKSWAKYKESFWDSFNAAIQEAITNKFDHAVIEWKLDPK